MRVAGIDVSTKAVDVVLLEEDGDGAHWHRLLLAKGGAWKAAPSAREVLPRRSWWEGYGVYLVGIEDPYSRRPHAAKAMGMVLGAVLALLPPDLEVLPMPPAEWKRESHGKANADKQMVALWAATHGFLPRDDNATDAYAIAWAARAINERAVSNVA